MFSRLSHRDGAAAYASYIRAVLMQELAVRRASPDSHRTATSSAWLTPRAPSWLRSLAGDMDLSKRDHK